MERVGFFLLVGCTAAIFLTGCAGTSGAFNSQHYNCTIQSSLVPDAAYGFVSDSTHPGGTWNEERDSVRSQVRLVMLAIIIGALIILAFTLGTGHRG